MPDAAPPPGETQIDSALPAQTARVLAMIAIVTSGICGGLIGFKVTALSMTGESDLVPGLVGLGGAAFAAGGVAIISVLVLRAMGEWRTIVETGDPAAARKRPS